MSKGKEIAAAVALTLLSGGAAVDGTARQEQCFDDVANEYGVESVSDLPESVFNSTGCVNLENTLGSLGVAGGVLWGLSIPIRTRFGRPKEDQPEPPAKLEEIMAEPIYVLDPTSSEVRLRARAFYDVISGFDPVDPDALAVTQINGKRFAGLYLIALTDQIIEQQRRDPNPVEPPYAGSSPLDAARNQIAAAIDTAATETDKDRRLLVRPWDEAYAELCQLSQAQDQQWDGTRPVRHVSVRG